MATIKSSKAASALAKAKWDKTPAKKRSEIMKLVRSAGKKKKAVKR